MVSERTSVGLDVHAQLETAMRSRMPIPHRAPRVQDVGSLLQLIAAAEDAYQQLIAQHVARGC